MPLTLRFNSPDATLANAGGKGLNLIRTFRAGFPVPPGFVLTTDAYRQFVFANGLTGAIKVAIDGVDPSDLIALELSAAAIRRAFREARMPGEIWEQVQREARAWGRTPLAVRSSATAEDLPDLSFAGQQDTFLNVLGPDALRAAIVDCWASLWTARAIGYRGRAGISHDEVALAVVVQELVDSEVSGVLFTANPLTGHRNQSVIDSTFGLGEALVSGQVEPDHFVIDTASGKVLEQRLGSKATRTTRGQAGGVETTAVTTYEDLSLDVDQVRELVGLGRQLQALFKEPQDVEWAYAGGQLHLLQSRPITSLYPLPPHDGPELAVWFSAGAFQGMLQPITPLGMDVLGVMVNGAARLFGFNYPDGNVPGLGVAGGRIWGRLDPIIRHPWGRKILPVSFPMIEPGSQGTLQHLFQDPRLAVTSRRGGLRSWLHVAPLLSLVALRIPLALSAPTAYRRGFQRTCDKKVAEVAVLVAATAEIADPQQRLARRLELLHEHLGSAFPLLLPRFGPIMGPGIAMTHQLGEMVQDKSLLLEALRALPGNPTTAMDLALWSAAQQIAGDSKARTRFRRISPERLAAEYLNGSLPPVAMAAIKGFLDQYGMRGVAEIDFGVPRWRDDPEGIIATIQGYLAVKDPSQAPDAVFARGEQLAPEAIAKVVASLDDGTHHGKRRATQARFMLTRIRGMFGARETPKFTIIRLFGIFREALLASAADLVEAGLLDRAEDVFFLELSELQGRWPAAPGNLRELVKARRVAYDQELRRRQVPRMLLSDGETFYDGAGHEAPEGAILGSAVSPGVVEGLVRVVEDPARSGLQRGEILVCTGTDPAWTPLFLTAAGLVTEVGGMMTHGSVVAREYGIPAVVGVHAATSRLVTGQRVRLDGNSGAIELLD